ncbi:Anthranilate synthase [Ignisphaera aggregans DSM 17230]|uniref:anthranilate synthase n=1 Tax=Ignisphaera aggregans (strain DSM 17230 / JCM 13409 / AQ1.S1) TaxID=583356 RepID=E0SS60_IGNAA|nr:Anthranilate synthase [Ignisphaera aggregans DSM 17230]
MKMFPDVLTLARCIDSKHNFYAIYEDLSSDNKYSIVVWGYREYIYGNDEDVFDRVSQIASKQFDGDIDEIGIRLIGYISYDAVRLWERIRDENPYLEEWPYIEMFIPENIAIYDYSNGKVYIQGIDIDYSSCSTVTTSGFKVSRYDESPTRKGFEDGVREILRFIREGYAFQVVLSRFIRYTYDGDLIEFYSRLRSINPSPYMYFMRMGDRYVIGSSPELLFRTSKSFIETFPIAGTRPRGRDINEDIALEEELMASEKDRAEHLMLVDLARNDLGKICIPGSVRVEKLMYIEKYSHVQHIVSKVIGILRKRVKFKDVVKAMLPAGTVSGAPKPFAMNLIEELEEFKRGPYAGAVGFIRRSGDSVMAIAIRSAFVYRDLIRIQAGAGIVYDSIPELEYEETEHKLRALKIALGVENA